MVLVNWFVKHILWILFYETLICREHSSLILCKILSLKYEGRGVQMVHQYIFRKYIYQSFLISQKREGKVI